MKKLIQTLTLLIAVSTSSLLVASETVVYLRGILDLGENRAFSLANQSGGSSDWLKIGQSFNGYKLVKFDPEERMLTLQKGDETMELQLAAAKQGQNELGTAEERLAEAQQIMELMNFEKMIDDTLDAQMDAMSSMIRQQMSQMGQDVDEDFIKFQNTLMHEMFADIDWKPIEAGMAKAYAEVFTQDELKGMTQFYTTPAGQATITKMPEVQQKTMQVMLPAIMQSSQKMQAKMVEYMQNKKENTE